MDKNKRSILQWITVQLTVDVLLWLAVGIPVVYLYVRGTPVERGFYCDDPALSYPYRPNTISTSLLVFLGIGISVIVVVTVEILNCISIRCSRHCGGSQNLDYCVKSYALFLLGFAIQQLYVDTMKNQMGFLRPNFFDVCRPQFNTSLCPRYISEYVCTNTEVSATELRDIRQSFPSGHSSFSMYIAAYFCLYINDRLKVTYSRILKFLLQSCLIFLSLTCGLLRIYDNKHHPCDVIAGFLLGMLVATALYKTVSKPLLPEDTDSLPVKCDKQSKLGTQRLCCACASSSSMEIQSPCPLIQNEYSDNCVRNGEYHAMKKTPTTPSISFSVASDKTDGKDFY